MNTSYDVVVLVGSLRKGSFNRMTAHAMKTLAPAKLRLEIVEIGELSLYNQDLDETPPASWVTFRNRIKRADAILFVTPEYNRSIPGVLKNAIDIGSRPYGQNAFDGKPTAIVSVTPGSLGAFGANHHLRQIGVFLNMLIMQQPEAYLGGVGKSFDASGTLTNDSIREFLQKFLLAFENWIDRLKK